MNFNNNNSEKQLSIVNLNAREIFNNLDKDLCSEKKLIKRNISEEMKKKMIRYSNTSKNQVQPQISLKNFTE